MSFGKSKRFSEIKDNSTPGPGDYEVNTTLDNRGFKICCSPRFPECKENHSSYVQCRKCNRTYSNGHSSMTSSNASSVDNVSHKKSTQVHDPRKKLPDERFYNIIDDLVEVRQEYEKLLENHSIQSSLVNDLLKQVKCNHVHTEERNQKSQIILSIAEKLTKCSITNNPLSKNTSLHYDNFVEDLEQTNDTERTYKIGDTFKVKKNKKNDYKQQQTRKNKAHLVLNIQEQLDELKAVFLAHQKDLKIMNKAVEEIQNTVNMMTEEENKENIN